VNVVSVSFLGGPLDGQEMSIAAGDLLGAEHVIEPESGTVYTLRAEQQPITGTYELIYLARGAPKRRRRQRPRPHPRLLAMLAPCYLSFLRFGMGHGEAAAATNVPYSRWLEYRQGDAAFDVVCRLARRDGQRLKAEQRSPALAALAAARRREARS
jgi:hypothetical protein